MKWHSSTVEEVGGLEYDACFSVGDSEQRGVLPKAHNSRQLGQNGI